MGPYSVADVASMLRVNEETVRRWIREGKLVATIKRGRGGSSVELSDIIAFVNRTPGSFVQTSMKKWLNENNIQFSIDDSTCKPQSGGLTLPNFSQYTQSLRKFHDSPDDYMTYTNGSIVLLQSDKKSESAMADENVVSLSDLGVSLNEKPSIEPSPESNISPKEDDIASKIVTEQMKLLRLKQELAQINAKISICEAEIEYYKLLQNEK